MDGESAVEHQVEVVIGLQWRKQDIAGVDPVWLEQLLQQAQAGLVDMIEQACLSQVLHFDTPHDGDILPEYFFVMTRYAPSILVGPARSGRECAAKAGASS